MTTERKKIAEITEKEKLCKRIYRNNLDGCEKERIKYNDRIRKQRQGQNINSKYCKQEVLSKS